MGPSERIERAAVELLDAHGLEGVTVRAIAARAHYHRSTVMYHIESVGRLRESMWRSIAASLLEDLFPDGRVDPRNEEWVGRVATVLTERWTSRPNRMVFFASYASVYGTSAVVDRALVEELFPGVEPDLVDAAADYALGLLASLARLLPQLPDGDARVAAVRSLVTSMLGELGTPFRAA